MHSGIQDVPEGFMDVPEEPVLKKGLDHGLNTQISTVSNTSDGALFCDICNIRVTSTKILQRHLEGRKHKSRAERRGKTFHCDICDVTANSEIQLNIHLSSTKHKSRVAREEYKEFFDVSAYSKSMYVLMFAVFCIILNLIILVKVAM
ncbi:zinc finger protein 385B-like [Euwallacea similis]|uniref:zinc finger protein 385B-like n=1 Tax=Euwallacea similis TaxID=1736056 RepID=UPI00344E2BD7